MNRNNDMGTCMDTVADTDTDTDTDSFDSFRFVFFSFCSLNLLFSFEAKLAKQTPLFRFSWKRTAHPRVLVTAEAALENKNVQQAVCVYDDYATSV